MLENSLIIFDCDGVLIDSEAIYLEIERAFLAKKGVDIDHGWYVTNFMALAQPLWRAKLSDLLVEKTGHALSDDEYTALKAESRRRVMAEIKPIDGVTDLLGSITSAMCVASSTQMAFLPGKLERTGLASYFGAHVYSGDMVENGKPAPDLFLHAARHSGGFEPESCIVVEDSVNGVIGAKAAGMKVIGFTGGSHCPPDHGDSLAAAGANVIVASHEALGRFLGVAGK